MAKARKCDRCKKLYETYNLRDEELKPNALIFTSLLDNSNYYSRKCIDLCPECMNEIINWFEEKGSRIDKEPVINESVNENTTE